MKKRPLLDALCTQFPGQERQRLLAYVLCGDVQVSGEKVRDPKRLVAETSVLSISGIQAGTLQPDDPPPLPWVSRGGDKLAGLMAAWKIPVAGKVWLDAGASTGGFTHCLLREGASLVHALDVGYNQLDWRLRQHPRVRCHERCNIMATQSLDPVPAAAVADLSFRSIAGPARRILDLCTEGLLYALVKPQFERKYSGKDVRDAEDFSGIVAMGQHALIISGLVARLEEEDVGVFALIPSVLKGSQGNQEYFALMKRGQGLGPEELLASLPAPGDPGSP